MKKEFDPLEFRGICNELSRLMVAAEQAIKTGSPSGLYSLKAHWYLMEQGWKIMLPLPKNQWPNGGDKLMRIPLLSWPDQILSDDENVLDLKDVKDLADYYYFGYAIVGKKLVKASFLVTKKFQKSVKYSIFFDEAVIDPFSDKKGIQPDYYIGCPVTLEDIFSAANVNGNPLENFIERLEEESHRDQMAICFEDTYKEMLGDFSGYFPQSVVDFVTEYNYYLPYQVEAKELQNLRELESKGTVDGKKPIDIIREMNPGTFIPSGEELAKLLRGEK
ncbi:MAG: hypothetical protein WCK59_00540 [Candidatus Falkowbacteria bacterium]